jgi:hypothetical protein
MINKRVIAVDRNGTQIWKFTARGRDWAIVDAQVDKAIVFAQSLPTVHNVKVI